jgi:glycosyltransferase involved in cell wall biosynthesis
MKVLVAVPVYNEVKMISTVLAEIRKYAHDILVINDGSTDG